MNTDLVLLDAVAGLKVLVIGEAMLDCYLEGFSDRLCQEAPVPVVIVTDRKQVPGGAANTAVNVHTLGGIVTFLSVIGDDWEGAILQRLLEEQGITTKYLLTQSGRQTLAKQRVVAASQLLVRFDQGNTDPIDSETERALIEQLERCFLECDAIIVSDYGYGILTERVIGAIAKLQQTQPRILVVDSKRLTAYRNANVTAVKPNYNEAVQLLGIEALQASVNNCEARTDQIATYKERLLDLTNAQIVAVTLDAEGAIIFERNCAAYRTYAQTANQSRATGAGDTFVSALTLALAAKTTTPVATELAASAAAVVVGKNGTTACSVRELRELLYIKEQRSRGDYLPFTATDKYVTDISSLVVRLTSYRASGRRIVFTNGCFDILHAGHVSYLNRARLLGDILIIGVNSDVSVSRLKGLTRPINPLSERIQVLAGLNSVDYLIPFDEDTPSNLIQVICPDVYVKGGDYTKETLPEAPIVEQLGGVVEILPFVENCSTTSMIERVCKAELEDKRQ